MRSLERREKLLLAEGHKSCITVFIDSRAADHSSSIAERLDERAVDREAERSENAQRQRAIHKQYSVFKRIAYASREYQRSDKHQYRSTHYRINADPQISVIGRALSRSEKVILIKFGRRCHEGYSSTRRFIARIIGHKCVFLSFLGRKHCKGVFLAQKQQKLVSDRHSYGKRTDKIIN